MTDAAGRLTGDASLCVRALGRVVSRPVVLAYHGVNHVANPDDPHRLIVPPELLESHIRMLLDWGYRFITAGELLAEGAERQPRRRTAVLTFDDGWADATTVAAPLLARLGVPATFYVCGGWWGGQHALVRGEAGRILDEEAACRLVMAGFELGSHTMTHPDLRELNDAELAAELTRSKAVVERVSGQPCRTLAYPFGLFDERVERAAGDAGYELAFAWMPGRWRRLAAPRLPGPPRHGSSRLALKLVGVRRRRP